jgi:hypothetical protein
VAGGRETLLLDSIPKPNALGHPVSVAKATTDSNLCILDADQRQTQGSDHPSF